jgi:hypothetical protein
MSTAWARQLARALFLAFLNTCCIGRFKFQSETAFLEKFEYLLLIHILYICCYVFNEKQDSLITSMRTITFYESHEIRRNSKNMTCYLGRVLGLCFNVVVLGAD